METKTHDQLPTLPFAFRMGKMVQHEKGGQYTIVGLPDVFVIEETGEPAYAYKAADGRVFVRSQKKMEDGRFWEVAPDDSDPIGLHTQLAIRELNEGPIRGTGAVRRTSEVTYEASPLQPRTRCA